MRVLSTCLRGALVWLLLIVNQSCSQRPDELPTPTSAPAGKGFSIAEAQAWYQGRYTSTASGTPTAVSSNSARTTADSAATSGNAALLWKRALAVGKGNEQLVLVPLTENHAPFAGQRWQGMRYLVIAKNDNQALDGNFVELLIRRTPTPVDTITLFTNLIRSHRRGRIEAPNLREGYLFLYSAEYRYLTGRHFSNGQLLRGTSQLVFIPSRGSSRTKSGSPLVSGRATLPTLPQPGTGTGPVANSTSSACTDWYDGSTGAYITTTGDCYNYPDFGGADFGVDYFNYSSGGFPADFYYYFQPGGAGYGGSGGSGVTGDTAELQSYEADYRSQMSREEIAIYDGLTRAQQVAYLLNAQTAVARAGAQYPTSLTDGAGDAFRHAFFVASNTSNLYLGADLALRLSNAHELSPIQTDLQREMDLHNNYSGLLIGLDPGDYSIEEAVISWLNDGRLLIIENNRNVPSHP